MRRALAIAVIAAAVVPGCRRERESAPAPAPPAQAAPLALAGTTACGGCHRPELEAWRRSQHAHAIAPGDVHGLRGDFTSKEFIAREGRYFVHALGPDGAPGDFLVKYAFGVEPLQQVILELPKGHLQAYTRAWDVAKKRWFDLYPNEKLVPGDELHWTGREQSWNYMCADCHSTDVRKGYDAATDSYDTRFAELTIGCEECHGPGSRHVEWARTKTGPIGLANDLSEHAGARWTLDPATGNSTRSRPRPDDRELETCAPCHARRAQLAEGRRAGEPLLDFYRPALLEEPTYWADGQQRAEDYTWGSFLQSRMYAHGVTCSDCHEPHTAELRAEGNALCERCHEQPKYDTPKHHFHAPDSAGAQCVNCHMPATTYMQIDPRRDHSLRVPQPALTVAIGVPNACDGCHREKGAAWAAAELRKRLGHDPTGFQTFGRTFHDAALGREGAGAALAALASDAAQPAIARASALERLGAHPQAGAAEAGLRAANDPSALVRLGAALLAGGLTAETRVAVAAPLCSDPVRAVRIEAARVLSSVPPERFDPAQRRAYQTALAEFTAAQAVALDLPGAHLNLAVVDEHEGRRPAAEAQYRSALRIDPDFTPARLNLSRLLNALDRNADAERVLRDGIARVPDQGELQYSLGLLLAEEKRVPEAATALGRAADLMPERARVRYNQALALQQIGRRADAEAAFLAAEKIDPADPEIAYALAILYVQAEEWARARVAAERLVTLSPNDPQAQQLLERIRQRSP
jgi:tetratricopeptide (TPR) repeat protein